MDWGGREDIVWRRAQGPACCPRSAICGDDQQAADVALSLWFAIWKGESLSAARIQSWGPTIKLQGLAKPRGLTLCMDVCVRTLSILC